MKSKFKTIGRVICILSAYVPVVVLWVLFALSFKAFHLLCDKLNICSVKHWRMFGIDVTIE